jgi:hypothetical protein
MFAEENRCTHHQDFLGDPAYRKFSGDGSWNPYVGLAKTHFQHLATAAALNVVRLGEWLTGTPRAKTRCSPFAALKAA